MRTNLVEANVIVFLTSGWIYEPLFGGPTMSKQTDRSFYGPMFAYTPRIVLIGEVEGYITTLRPHALFSEFTVGVLDSSFLSHLLSHFFSLIQNHRESGVHSLTCWP